VALLKAARPDLDPSVAGLTRRLERLERGASSPAASPPAAPPPAAGAPSHQASAERPKQVETPPGDQAPEIEEAPLPTDPSAVPEPEQSVAPEPAPAPAPEPVSESAPEPAGIDLDHIGQVWPAVMDALRGAASGPTASYFEGTRPVSLEGGRLTVGFPAGAQFNRRNAEKPERRSHLEAALLSVIGEDLELQYADLGADGTAGTADQPPAPEPVDEEAMVERVISEFNAEEVI
jgi:hypothetical protein